MKSIWAITWKVLLGILGVVLVAAVGYVIYFFCNYYRIDDNQELKIEKEGAGIPVETGTEYTISTYNVGFGAYSDDYGFFMDGGTESRGFSKEAVLKNISGAIDTIEKQNVDFAFFQEVDLDSTRSYHVNQYEMVTAALTGMDHTLAINFDSPYLFYPITKPHGKSKSGIVTLSKFSMLSAVRKSLPIDSGLSKFVDLDRCYSITEVDAANGKKLYLFNVHLSAYSNEPDTVESQVALLVADMKQRAEGGNYVIVGGDFNQDVLGNSAEVFHTGHFDYSWAKAFDQSVLPDNFSFAKLDETEKVIPTCRLADGPYVEGESFVIAIDGFIVSDNITVKHVEHIDTGFKYSDHNPVSMKFILE